MLEVSLPVYTSRNPQYLDCLFQESNKDTCLAPKLCLEAPILIPFIQPFALECLLLCTRSCSGCWAGMTGGGVFLVGPNFRICLFRTTEQLPWCSVGKESACSAGDTEMGVWSMGREHTLEEKMATHSSIFAWKSHGQRSLVGYSPWCQ